MEKELNIAAILKGKPGAKLWSPIIGACALNHINSSSDINVTIGAGIYYNGSAIYSMTFNSRGKYGGEFKDNTIERECMLFPSKKMRDWEKFAWKKGDVLISKDTDSLCVFDSFEDDTYSTFNAKYYHNPLDFSINLGVISRATEPFTKVDDDEAKNFIRKIGEHYGGKLNLKTLEIEHEPQFKDGDIVCFYGGRGCFDTIAIVKEQGEPTYRVYAFLEIPIMKFYYQDDKFFPYTRKLRFATDSEKQQLFDALAKEGKRWNVKTKTLEDLPKKCEFKPFDKVLVRDKENDEWRISLFSHYTNGIYPYFCLNATYKCCIPYNDQTAHLLGTTDDWEGGEE